MKFTKSLMILIVVLILCGASFLFVKNIENDKKNSEVTMTEIKNNYQNLEEKIVTYNQNREEIASYLDSFYEEKFLNEYDKIISSFKKQDDTLKDIQAIVKSLDSSCKDKLFKDANVNKKCSNYTTLYEKLVNVYQNDINKVNDIISIYNEGKEEQLSMFKSSNVEEYIDYNQDGIYLEKEDTNEKEKRKE